MINFFGDVKALLAVLQDPAQPIQAAKNWATRTKSLATGEAGLAFSTLPVIAPYAQIEVRGDVEDIFTAQIEWDGNSLTFYNDDGPLSGEERVLGDIFDGECARFWTSLIIGEAYAERGHTRDFGQVVRPGLAHGDLIRDLREWYIRQRGTGEEFEAREVSFAGFGWCNGYAGLVVSQAVASMISKGLIDRDFAYSSIDQIFSMFETSQSDSETGLCHGVAGALVVAIGLARIIEDERLMQKTRDTFRALYADANLTRYPEDLLVDLSWLTGTSGFLWAAAVMEERPTINPIFPPDSASWRLH